MDWPASVSAGFETPKNIGGEGARTWHPMLQGEDKLRVAQTDVTTRKCRAAVFLLGPPDSPAAPLSGRVEKASIDGNFCNCIRWEKF